MTFLINNAWWSPCSRSAAHYLQWGSVYELISFEVESGLMAWFLLARYDAFWNRVHPVLSWQAHLTLPSTASLTAIYDTGRYFPFPLGCSAINATTVFPERCFCQLRFARGVLNNQPSQSMLFRICSAVTDGDARDGWAPSSRMWLSAPAYPRDPEGERFVGEAH